MPESHPSPLIGPQNVTDDRIVALRISDADRTVRRRANPHLSQSGDESVGLLSRRRCQPGHSFVDHVSDATISNSSSPGFQQLDFNGPRVTPDTPLVDVQSFDGSTYNDPVSDRHAQLHRTKRGPHA